MNSSFQKRINKRSEEWTECIVRSIEKWWEMVLLSFHLPNKDFFWNGVEGCLEIVPARLGCKETFIHLFSLSQISVILLDLYVSKVWKYMYV